MTLFDWYLLSAMLAFYFMIFEEYSKYEEISGVTLVLYIVLVATPGIGAMLLAAYGVRYGCRLFKWLNRG